MDRTRILVENFEPGRWGGVLPGDPSPDLAWSPDGTRLTYREFSAPNHRRLRIWTVALDSSAPSLVASHLNDTCCIDGGGPAWSPDGSQIAFETDRRPVVVDAGEAGELRPIDELTYLSWHRPSGWYFCYCFG